MANPLRQGERDALSLIYELMFEKLEFLHRSVDSRRKRAISGLKEDMLSEVYSIRDIQSLSEMMYLVAQDRDSGVCMECEGVFDHNEGCAVDREENPGFAW